MIAAPVVGSPPRPEVFDVGVTGVLLVGGAVVAEGVPDGTVPVALGVGLTVALGVGVGLTVALGVGVGLTVALGVGLTVPVGVGDPVAVGEAVGDAVGEAVPVGVGCPVGSGLRPMRPSGTWANPSSAWAVARRHWSRSLSASPLVTASVSPSAL